MRTVTRIPKNVSPYVARTLQMLVGKDVLALYEEIPLKIRRTVKGLSERQLSTPPAKGKWSIRQIIAHLCDTEQAFSYRVRKMLAESGSPIQAFDQDRWVKHLHYDRPMVREQLELFGSLRRVNGSLFRCLTPAELRRYGIHEERGRETVERLIQLYTGHGINHLRQIEAIRKKLLAAEQSH